MKKISLIIFSIFLSFLIINKVDASSATISVYSSKSTVIVGDTVTVTVKVSSSAVILIPSKIGFVTLLEIALLTLKKASESSIP